MLACMRMSLLAFGLATWLAVTEATCTGANKACHLNVGSGGCRTHTNAAPLSYSYLHTQNREDCQRMCEAKAKCHGIEYANHNHENCRLQGFAISHASGDDGHTTCYKCTGCKAHANHNKPPDTKPKPTPNPYPFVSNGCAPLDSFKPVAHTLTWDVRPMLYGVKYIDLVSLAPFAGQTRCQPRRPISSREFQKSQCKTVRKRALPTRRRTVPRLYLNTTPTKTGKVSVCAISTKQLIKKERTAN